MTKRVFLLVMDSFGVGALPDAAAFGDEGSNTLGAVACQKEFDAPCLRELGLFNLPGLGELQRRGVASPKAAYGRMAEVSAGKDTTIGHWELAGLISPKPLPTYPDGFPEELLEEFTRRTGRSWLCNKPYSGTDVIRDYGREMVETGKLIVYTSADSVFQIAAHEAVVPVEELYRICRIARELLTGEQGVGRVIARPFTGEWPYTRTSRRHDFSLPPPGKALPQLLSEAGLATIGVGKIGDIFAGVGIQRSCPTTDNRMGMELTIQLAKEAFTGLCFVNLVDFDSVYGHRNDAPGYAAAVSRFDLQLRELLALLRPEDVLVITADHGCDPATPSTDHSREYVPVLVYGQGITPAALGTRSSYADLAATVQSLFGLPVVTAGESFAFLLKGE